MQKKIIVTIDPLANTTVEAEGFNGVGCADATKAIEQAVAGGGGVVTREFKPEYRGTDSGTQQRQTTRMG